LRTIIFILLILSVYFGVCVFVGLQWALTAMSLFLIILATIFVFKRDSYIQYIQLVNPKYAALYNGKDDKFRKSHRITDIIIFYLLSSFLLFMSINIPNTKLTVSHTTLVYLLLVAVIFSIFLWLFSLFILKKSKNNSSFWFYFIGLVLLLILVLCLIV
jgi:hypothetical protein